jgi:long-chain fatty acid transport protein
MATAEWSNWSRIGTSVWTAPGGVAHGPRLPGDIAIQYKDGWFFSGGAEYKWTDRLTVRAASVMKSRQSRIKSGALIPDNDRFWASVGATWQVFRASTSISPIRTSG